MTNSKKGSTYTTEQRKKVISKQFGNNKTIKDPAGRIVTKSNAQVDHIVPKAKGGKATLKNAQVLHPKTNQEKSDKLSGKIGPKSNQKVFKVNTKTQTMSVKKANSKHK